MDLTDDYASIPAEMKAEQKLWVQGLKLTMKQVVDKIPMGKRLTTGSPEGQCILLTKTTGYQAGGGMEEDNFEEFLSLIKNRATAPGSGQNCYSHSPLEQGVTWPLPDGGFYRDNRKGACRVHGGSFAGTIQVPAQGEGQRLHRR